MHVVAELGAQQVREPDGSLEERGTNGEVDVIPVAPEQLRDGDELPRDVQLVGAHRA